MVKILHVMRAMGIKRKTDRDLGIGSFFSNIGMAVHEQKSVFSFFSPLYKPSGPISNAGLVAPETQLLTAPMTMSFLNTINSVVKYGIVSPRCYAGSLGHTYSGYELGNGFDLAWEIGSCSRKRVLDPKGRHNWPGLGRYNYVYPKTQSEKIQLMKDTQTDAVFTYQPKSDVVEKALDEMDLLFTGGRSGQHTKDKIAEAMHRMGTGHAFMVARGDGTDPLMSECKLINETHNGRKERFNARCCSDKYTGHGPPHAPDWGGWQKQSDWIDSARISSTCRTKVTGGK